MPVACSSRSLAEEPYCVRTGSFGATTSALGVELLREHLLSVYQEQLFSRPKPSYRSEESFYRILETSYRACEARLATLFSANDVFQFASKCLREKEWKEKFLCGGAEICTSHSIPYSVQAAFVHTEEEAPDFERHLSHALGIFDSSLNPQSTLEEPIDLCAEPSSASSAATCAFACPLQSEPADTAIDLD